MGKGGYLGGSTVIRRGSNWFGGRQKTKPQDLGKGELSARSGPRTKLETQVAA
jgi:hypothetical protein